MKPLNEEDKQYVRENRTLGPSALARKLGSNKGYVQRFMKSENLQLNQEETRKVRVKSSTGRTTFTPQMDEYLKENYLKIPIKRIGDHLGKSYCGVTIRMRQLKLEIPKEIVELNKQAGRFKAGFTPHNKGRDIREYMSLENQKKISKNRFKKGNRPHNAKAVGTIVGIKDTKTGRIYLQKKVAEPSHWRFLHHIIYEEATGKKIPEDKILTFRDGNSANMNVDNLEVISKKQNASRNKRSFENLPKPLKRVIRLTNKINKLCKI